MSFLDFLFHPDIDKLKEKADVKGLIDAFECDKNEIREKAVSALVYIGEPAVKLSIEALSDEGKSGYTSEALVKIGIPALESLAAGLKTDDERIKRKIIQIMGEIGHESAVDPLFRLLGTEADMIKRMASSAIVKIGKKAGGPLALHLNDDSKEIRTMTSELLDKIGWQPATDSEKALHIIAKQEWLQLLQIGGPAIKHLVDVLDDDDLTVRKEAATILGRIGSEEVVEPLIKALTHPKYKGLRDALASALGEIRDKRAVEPLISALNEELSDEHRTSLELDDREEMIKALGKIGDDRAAGVLIAALENKDIYIRESAAQALGNLRDKIVVNPLIKALKDRDEDVRQKAAESLGNQGDPEAVNPLVAALNDEDMYVRRNAIIALGNIRSPDAVDALLKILKHKDLEIYAAEALGKIGSSRAVPALSQGLDKGDNSIIRCKSAEALGLIGNADAIDPLIRALSAEDWQVRFNVVKALEQIGDARAMPHMEKLLQDSNPRVSESAGKALKTLKNKAS